MNHFVEIIETKTGTIAKRMGPLSEREAERVEEGALINLNHDAYHTQIVVGFRPGDSVTYTASDTLKTAQIESYPAIVMKSSVKEGVNVEPAKYRIQYTKEGKVMRSWVSAKKVRARKA